MQVFMRAAFVALLLVAPAAAGVTVDLLSGSSVTGSLDPVDEVERFTIEVPAGAVLKIKAKGVRKGPVVGVRITDDQDAVVGTGEIKEKKAGIVGKVPLERGGVYTIDVLSRDLDTPGGYSLKVSWKSPKRYTDAPPAAAGGTVSFRADRGALVSATVSAAKGSVVAPRLTRITGPNDFEVSFGPPAKRAGDRVKKVPVAFTGDYTLHYANDGAGGGDVNAKVTVAQPRPSRAQVDVSDRAIESGDAGGGSAVGIIALTDVATVFAVPEPVDPDDPLTAIADASIEIPANALKTPSPIVIGTTSQVAPPPKESATIFEDAGPPVFFGPAGLKFIVPVELTLPADVVADQDDVVVLTREGKQTSLITEGLEVADGFVTLAVSHFSSFQVFTAEPRPYVESKLTPTQAASTEAGSSLAVAGSTIVVGAPRVNAETGAAFVYTRDETGAWRKQAKLTAGDAEGSSQFGASAAVDEDTAVIGAPRHSSSGVFNRGAVYVFTHDGTGTWTQQARLEIVEPPFSSQLGKTVSIDGDTLVAGAPTPFGVGGAYVFTRSGAGVWTQQAELIGTGVVGGPNPAVGGPPGDDYGTSVAVHGDTAVVSAPGNGGAAYVFTRDGAGTWSEHSKLLADGTGGGGLGSTVDVHEDTIACGAPLTSHDGQFSGSAYIFTRDGGGIWTQQMEIRASDAAAGDRFGRDVAVDGDSAVFGASRANTTTGAAYVFVRSEGGVWTERIKLTASDGEPFDTFGLPVALHGATVVIGATNDGDARGAAYVFDFAE